MTYTFRNEVGMEIPFKCNLDDEVMFIGKDAYARIGKVVALDDDGYIIVETPSGEERTHNSFIIGVGENKRYLGRTWLREVPYVPNTDWSGRGDCYNNDGYDDWKVADLIEGELWMNNGDGYVVLVQPNGICLVDYF